MSLMNEIKILVIEDEVEHFEGIQKGLLEMTKDDFVQLEKDNIIYFEVSTENPIKYSNLMSTIKEEKINCLFIDLYYGDHDGKLEGIELIKTLTEKESKVFKYIPKYIITSAGEAKENPEYSNIFQYAHYMAKPPSKIVSNLGEVNEFPLSKKYKSLFESEQLHITLPILVGMYEAIVEKFKLYGLLENIKHTVYEAQINNEDILKYLQLQSQIIDKIDLTTDNILERTKLIEIITKSIAKALPKIADKSKAQKLIDEWEDNIEFTNAMGSDFPELPAGLYNAIKEGFSHIANNSTEDISKLLYDAGKTYINEKAGIDKDDDKMIALMKYSAYFTEKVSDIILKK